MDINLTLPAVLLASYLAGSLPSSLVAGRWAAGIDIREHGSGNAGATNVYRVLGLRWAVAVGLVDVAKGVVASLLISRLQIGGPASVDFIVLQLMAGTAAVAGHIWTIFAHFRGGKGVATAVGALVGIAPVALAVCLGIWLGLLLIVRIMSVASMAAALALPAVVWWLQRGPDGSPQTALFAFCSLLAALILFTHRRNLGRLLRGQEPRLGHRSAPATPASPQPEEAP